MCVALETLKLTTSVWHWAAELQLILYVLNTCMYILSLYHFFVFLFIELHLLNVLFCVHWWNYTLWEAMEPGSVTNVNVLKIEIKNMYKSLWKLLLYKYARQVFELESNIYFGMHLCPCICSMCLEVSYCTYTCTCNTNIHACSVSLFMDTPTSARTTHCVSFMWRFSSKYAPWLGCFLHNLTSTAELCVYLYLKWKVSHIQNIVFCSLVLSHVNVQEISSGYVYASSMAVLSALFVEEIIVLWDTPQTFERKDTDLFSGSIHGYAVPC